MNVFFYGQDFTTTILDSYYDCSQAIEDLMLFACLAISFFQIIASRFPRASQFDILA